MLSAFVEPDQATVLRTVADNAVFVSEEDGCTYKNGLLHSFDDQPALVIDDFAKEWLKDGKWHREGDKPAVIYDGIFKYYDNDILHRKEGPAVTSDKENFRHEWWENGKRHRIGGPAVYDGNIQEWWENGVFIRREEMQL
jgi:small nuclear ribonucleoprotein (snRNP)-like protein